MTSEANTKAQKRAARRFRRLTVRIEVEYQTPDDGVSREFATTLGAGGLFIESERPLARKSRIKLAFALPGCGQQHEIEGRVVWATYPAGPSEAQRTAGMGIQFTDRVAEAQLARDLETWQPVTSE